MTKTTRTRLFATLQMKTLLMASMVVISSVAAIILSQPTTAVASIMGEACDTDSYASNDAHVAESFAHTAFLSQNSAAQQDALFWNSLTKAWLTAEQIRLLQLAYQIGVNDADQEHAEFLQAVLLQETIAGQLGRIGHMTAPVGKRSYGVMQVKVSAARDVLRKHKDLGRFRSDEELIVKLMSDDEFNIQVASKFLLKLTDKTDSVDKSLVAYNIGLRASRKIADPQRFRYVEKTRRNLSEVVKPFNQRFAAAEMQLAMN